MSFARVRALVIVGALVVCAAIVVVVTLLKDQQVGSTSTECPDDAIIADLILHPEEEIPIKIFDGSGGAIPLLGVTNEFTGRGFQVAQADPGAEAQQPVPDVAIIRYGPKAVGNAWVVQAHFLNDVKREFQLNRTDNSVDVVVGGGFKKLATDSEVKQALWQSGRPPAPPGTCADS